MAIPNVVAIVDIETTEPNANTPEPRMIEAGCVLYSVPHRCIISSSSFIVLPNSERKPPDFYSTTVCRIPQSVFETHGLLPPDDDDTGFYLRLFGQEDIFVEFSDFFCIAHGASFERKFLTDPAINWLCTLKDFELFPPEYQGQRTLKDLAQYYGVGISVTHRAIYDCLLLAEVLTRVPDLEKQFEIAQLPMCELMAPRFLPDGSKNKVGTQGFNWDHDRQGWFAKDRRILGESFPQENVLTDSDDKLCKAIVSYDKKDLAKQWGFRWNGESKAWEKLVRKGTEDHYPFSVVELSNEGDLI